MLPDLLTLAGFLGIPASLWAHLRGGPVGHATGATATCALAVRDAAMIAGGAPARLRPWPRALLFVEVVVGGVATLAGLAALLPRRRTDAGAGSGPDALGRLAAGAGATAFVTHATRMWIYTTGDHGRLPVPQDQPLQGLGLGTSPAGSSTVRASSRHCSSIHRPGTSSAPQALSTW